MEQLVLRWVNDGSPAVMPQVPEGLGLTALPEMKDGVEQWLDVVQFGLSEGRQGQEYYDTVMVGHENYDAQYCYLITDGDRAAATVTVIFDNDLNIFHAPANYDQYARGFGVLYHIYQKFVYHLIE